MPVITVHRYSRSVGPSFDGAQFVDGDLVIEPSPATKPVIKLANAIYNETKPYVLFSYSGTFSGSLSDLTIDDSALLLASYAPPLTLDTAKKRVVMTLQSKSTNGTQYVDGDLNIAGTHTFKMSKALYATPGTFVLFDVAGTITPGSLANLQLDLPSGLSLDPAVSPNPFTAAGGAGTQIKVTLI